MSVRHFRSGAIRVYLPKVEKSITTPNFNLITPLVSAITVDDELLRDVRDKVSSSANYQILLAPHTLGQTVKGYVSGQASAGSGVITGITSSQGILISVAASSWAANSNYLAGVQVWLKKGNDNFKLHSIVPIDTANLWQTVVVTDCTVDAISKTATVLQSTTADDDLGPAGRLGYGVSFTLAGISQDGVNVDDSVEQINYRPDTSTNYFLAITRGMTVSFSLLNNSQKDIVNANAGEYVKWTDGQAEIKQALMNYQSSSAIATGNVPLRLIYPVDENKALEELYMYATVAENQTGSQSNWGKQNPPVTSYTYSTINMDGLLQAVHAVCRRIRRSV